MYWACLWNHCGAQMRDKRSRTALWWGGAVTWHVFVFFKLRHLQPLPSAGSFSLFHLPKYTSRSNTTIARLSPGCVGQIRLSERQTGFWRKGLKTRRRSVACAAPAHKQSVKKKKKEKRRAARAASCHQTSTHPSFSPSLRTWAWLFRFFAATERIGRPPGVSWLPICRWGCQLPSSLRAGVFRTCRGVVVRGAR